MERVLQSALPPIDIFGEKYRPFRFVMAPMAGITDSCFRRLMRELGAEVVVSELVSAEGLIRGGHKSRSLMSYCEDERPVGIQLFGSSISSLTEAAKIVESTGADFVDLNFGCPVKKVVKDGGGAAWLKDPRELSKLLVSIRGAIEIPLTIKVRTGWDSDSVNVGEVAKVAGDCGASWIAIHGRTRAQGYSGEADWEIIRRVSLESPIPVIGNGDILTAEQAKARIRDGYSHGVMIGRGALKNPWLFKQILGKKADFHFPSLIERHFELAVAHKGDYRAFLTLKKFLAWYGAGYPNASSFRRSIFNTSDIRELKEMSLTYFASVSGAPNMEAGKPFLMGGHG